MRNYLPAIQNQEKLITVRKKMHAENTVSYVTLFSALDLFIIARVLTALVCKDPAAFAEISVQNWCLEGPECLSERTKKMLIDIPNI